MQDRTVLVTGGESGIGRACSQSFAAAGAQVAICYHSDTDEAASIAAEIAKHGGRAITAQIDVSNEQSVEAAFDAATEAFGVPSILINSAGLNQSGVHVADMELAQWQRMIASDLTGAFLTSRRFVRDLIKAKVPGRIINISSIHAEDVRAGAADYCAAKAGLLKLTQTMALECAPLGITVNAIAPGMILTPMNARAVSDEAYRVSLERNIPAGRAGQPEEIAALALYLASDTASYITGANITIDGGLSLVLGQNA